MSDELAITSQDVLESLDAKVKPAPAEEPQQGQLELVPHGDPIPDEEPPPLQTEGAVEEEAEVKEDPKEEEPEEPEVDEQETIAQIFGLEEDQVKITKDGIYFKATVDDKAVELSLNDLIASYQATEFSSRRAQELVDERTAFEQKASELFENVNTKLQEMDTVSQLMEKELIADYNSVDWPQLMHSDPRKYNKLREQYSAKARRVKELKDHLSTEAEQQQQRQNEIQQEQMGRYLKAERDKMLAANPTWNDNKVRDKEIGQLRGFLTDTYGFTEEEMATITDNRMVRLIQDAYKATAPGSTIKGKENKPRFQKNSSEAKIAAAANARAAKARKQALRKSGGTNKALAQVLLDRM